MKSHLYIGEEGGVAGNAVASSKRKFCSFFVEKNYKLGQELRTYKPFQQQNEADKIFMISMN